MLEWHQVIWQGQEDLGNTNSFRKLLSKEILRRACNIVSLKQSIYRIFPRRSEGLLNKKTISCRKQNLSGLGAKETSTIFVIIHPAVWVACWQWWFHLFSVSDVTSQECYLKKYSCYYSGLRAKSLALSLYKNERKRTLYCIEERIRKNSFSEQLLTALQVVNVNKSIQTQNI